LVRTIRVFGPKRDEIIGGIIRVIKKNKMGSARRMHE
jgi:hypothetical protein